MRNMEHLKPLQDIKAHFEFTTSFCASDNLPLFLARHLPAGSSLLELGSGSGDDLTWLTGRYRVTASDICEDTVSRLRASSANTPMLQLDALSIDHPEPFDCIFSNKVMQHLSDEEMCRSMQRQAQMIRPGGIVAHTFWVNTSARQKMHSTAAHAHARLIRIVSMYFDVKEIVQYCVFAPNDSILVIARNTVSHGHSRAV